MPILRTFALMTAQFAKRLSEQVIDYYSPLEEEYHARHAYDVHAEQCRIALMVFAMYLDPRIHPGMKSGVVPSFRRVENVSGGVIGRTEYFWAMSWLRDVGVVDMREKYTSRWGANWQFKRVRRYLKWEWASDTPLPYPKGEIPRGFSTLAQITESTEQGFAQIPPLRALAS